ncbi:MAG: proteasome accessory factor PafA2 family protein, partial [Bifidobacteriaceae bacterium]|nr:proteasome accessory factor PafA2 family protein [Bifidobacteriaceae bacterium]
MPQLRASDTVINEDSQSLHEQYDYTFDRIFGIETEYGISVTNANSNKYSDSDHSAQEYIIFDDISRKSMDPQSVALAIFRPVISRARSTNTYVNNGSRLYLDVGAHPEYATAEARNPYEALLQDLAGEQIMANLANKAQESLFEDSGVKIHLFKNNVDSAGNSFGCHENYLVRRFVTLQDLEQQLIPFLISRQIFTGAGRFANNRFSITQRAEFMDEVISSATTRSRPMINTRDEPHAPAGLFMRLHVIIGDSNRLQWSTFMKLATTHLVLCVIEYARAHNVPCDFENFALQNPHAANIALSNDTTCMSPSMVLQSGKIMSALQLQQEYVRIVEQFFDEHGYHMLDQRMCDYKWVIKEWKQALYALES